MPTPTYDLIASSVLSTDAVTVTFSSIPGTYRDLVLVADGSIEAGYAPDILLRFNGDTGSNYNFLFMYGTGANAESFGLSGSRIAGWQERSNFIAHIMDYSATNKHKTTLTRYNTNQTSYGLGATVMRWANTSAITSLRIDASNDPADFKSGTTFYLYGIVS